MFSIGHSLFKEHPSLYLKISLMFCLENVLEGIGISLMVPVFYYFLGTSDGGSENFAWVQNLFTSLGLPTTLEWTLGLMISLFVLRGAVMYFSRKIISDHK